MNRKLIAVNAALLLMAALAGLQLRKQWESARLREAAKLGVRMTALPAPPHEALAQQAAVVPATYIDVARRMLWDRTRDSTVVEPGPPAPLPPPPMPALPAYHGMMNLGPGGAIALLSVEKSSPQGVPEGGRIGQFKLLAVNSEVISFEWNGQRVERNTRDLSAAAQPRERTDGPGPAPVPAKPDLRGPGPDTGRGRACNVNDGYATGTVIDGYRKSVFSTPFGASCAWEPAR